MFNKLHSFENLFNAYLKAVKGKKKKSNVSTFSYFAEPMLFDLQRQLQDKSWKPSGYKTFKIYDPKERIIRVPGYIRYVDDFVLFGKTKRQLHIWCQSMEAYLASLRLSLHPRKTQIYQVKQGVPFLGFQVYPYYRHVLKAKVKRYKRFLKKKVKYYKAGTMTPEDLEAALNAWLGHIRTGQSQRLEAEVLKYLMGQNINVVIAPNGAWKVLDL